MHRAIKRASAVVGSVPELARILKVSRAALYQWPRCPPLRVLQVEAATGGIVTRHELRPDLYPVENDG